VYRHQSSPRSARCTTGAIRSDSSAGETSSRRETNDVRRCFVSSKKKFEPTGSTTDFQTVLAVPVAYVDVLKSSLNLSPADVGDCNREIQ